MNGLYMSLKDRDEDDDNPLALVDIVSENTGLAPCVVCGNTNSGEIGWGMFHAGFAEIPGKSWTVCEHHKDDVLLAVDGYDRHASPAKMVVARMTRDDAIALRAGQEVQFLHYGDSLKQKRSVVRRAKVTSVKTWKRRDDVEVHWKYGLKRHFTSTAGRGHDGMLMEDLVVVLLSSTA